MSASFAKHRVTDFAWRGDRAGAGSLFGVPLDQAARDLDGQFALHERSPGGVHRLARDPLGVNKLFFAAKPGGVASASFWIDLVRAGHPPSQVWSVPAGHVLEIDLGAQRLALHRHAPLAFRAEGPEEPEPEVVARVRAALAAAFERLRPIAQGRPLYVTLSGGLDSTVVAVLAREHLGPFTAVSFALEPGDSDDARFAGQVAGSLGVPLDTVVASRASVLDQLDEVLLYGQDWRDFNVHCALVNAALARAIAARHAGDAGPRPLVLTGDCMNELVADYTPVEYAGRVFYRLPRMTPGRLRPHLVAGLDAGDREVGVFAHHGIDVLQPYALCAPAYAELPDALVGTPGAKQRFVRALMGDRVPAAIYERPKVRAQVGSADRVGGTLALLADAGIDAEHLAQRFAALFGIERSELAGFIRAGCYRYPGSYEQLEPT